MGCWNATCGISNLPIVCGERVAVFVCNVNSIDTTPSYSTTMCSPIYFHVKGEYNDYGSIENIDENKYNNNLIRLINKKYDQDFKDIESCIDKISCGDIDDLFLFMVKEDLFYTLINEVGNRKPYNRNFSTRLAYLSKIKKIQKTIIKLNKMEDDNLDYIFKEIKLKEMKNDLFFGFDKFSRISKNKIYIDTTLEYILFQNAMEFLRKSFMPMSGCGSQCTEMYLHKLVGEYTIKTEQDYISESEEFISEDNRPSKSTTFWF